MCGYMCGYICGYESFNVSFQNTFCRRFQSLSRNTGLSETRLSARFQCFRCTCTWKNCAFVQMSLKSAIPRGESFSGHWFAHLPDSPCCLPAKPPSLHFSLKKTQGSKTANLALLIQLILCLIYVEFWAEVVERRKAPYFGASGLLRRCNSRWAVRRAAGVPLLILACR